MTDPVREGFEKLELTGPYQDWERQSNGNTIDAAKLAKKLAGVKSTKPGSKYAQALWRMLDGLQPAPTPPSPVAPVWKRDMVFSTALSSFHDPDRSVAIDLGWTNVCPEILHGADPGANIRELELIGSRLRAQGCVLTGWGTFGQDTDPAQDAREAVELVGDLKLDGWIANGEAWAEGVNAGKSQAFIDSWLKAGGKAPLATSCLASDTASHARSYDYAAWLKVPGCAIMPQVYGNLNPLVTWQATLGMLAHGGVLPNRISMTFGTYVDTVKKLPVPFDAYRTWPGMRGAYIGERMPSGGWARMVSLG